MLAIIGEKDSAKMQGYNNFVLEKNDVLVKYPH